VGAPDTTLARLALVHPNTAGDEPHCLNLGGGRFSIRDTIIAADPVHERGLCVAYNADSGMLDECLVLSVAWLSDTNVSNSLFLHQVMAFKPCRFDLCTFLKELQIQKPGGAVVDSVIYSTHIFDAAIVDLTMANCSIFSQAPFRGSRTPTSSYFQSPPQFVDPSNLDYRLQPTSSCKGKASDGGDIGCRYTSELAEMVSLAQELRARGILAF
jgi:hypothetical protein